MARSQLPTPDALRQLLRYEPETGKLFWLERPDGPAWWNTRYAGAEAMTNIVTAGYKASVLNGRAALAHRVIWAIVHGEWPTDDVDHINGVRTDNRLCNLRAVDRATNCKNMARNRRNTSGVTGVSKCGEKWKAYIRSNGVFRVIGLYDEFSDAVTARHLAEREDGFHPNHGRAMQ